MLDSGLCAGYADEGLWLFSLLTPSSFDPGWLQGRHVLHVKVPASAWKTDVNSRTTLLRRQNAGRSSVGHLRFLLHGQRMRRFFLRCRLVGIYHHFRRRGSIDQWESEWRHHEACALVPQALCGRTPTRNHSPVVGL